MRTNRIVRWGGRVNADEGPHEGGREYLARGVNSRDLGGDNAICRRT